jgi:hypothetical protein
MPAEKARTGTPLEMFDRALAGASHGDFIEMWVRLFEEAAKRVETYVSAVEDGSPVEVLNEASRFVERVHDLSPNFFVRNTRAQLARRGISDARAWLADADERAASERGGDDG